MEAPTVRPKDPLTDLDLPEHQVFGSVLPDTRDVTKEGRHEVMGAERVHGYAQTSGST